MLNIQDVEEKRLIIAYQIAKSGREICLKRVWDYWCADWPKDFRTDDGRVLKMYKQQLVLSKNQARHMSKINALTQEFKEYDDLLAATYDWIKKNYNGHKCSKRNANIFMEQLLFYRRACFNDILAFLDNSGLKSQGYILQNLTKKKHPLLLSEYMVFIKENDNYNKLIIQGTYQQVMDYLRKKGIE